MNSHLRREIVGDSLVSNIKTTLMIQNNGLSPEYIQLPNRNLVTCNLYMAVFVPGASIENYGNIKSFLNQENSQTHFILKVYSSPELSLNQIVTLDGFLINNVLGEFENLNEKLVIHVESFEVIEMEKNFSSCLSCDFNPIEIRMDLISYLAQITGDNLLAEYLLLHMLSKGKDGLSLSLSRMNLFNSCPSSLCEIFSLLLPKTIHLDLSLENLNKKSFLPHITDDIHQDGILQFSKHTYLTVNEGCLEAGVLNEIGIKNLEALGDLVSRYECLYKVNGFDFPIPTEANILIFRHSDKGISVKGSEIIPGDLNIPLISSFGKCPYLPNEKKRLFQGYIQKFRFQKLDADQPFHDYIVEEFVNYRKTSSLNAEQDGQYLTHKVNLARSMTLSFGKNQLDADIWERVKALESQRLARLEEKVGH